MKQGQRKLIAKQSGTFASNPKLERALSSLYGKTADMQTPDFWKKVWGK